MIIVVPKRQKMIQVFAVPVSPCISGGSHFEQPGFKEVFHVLCQLFDENCMPFNIP